MTPELLILGVAPAGGAIAMLTEALSRKRDLLPLVRNPVRALAEQGDGFVHAKGRLEAAGGFRRPLPDGRVCLAYRLRLEARGMLGDATELWRTAGRESLRLRDSSGTAVLAESVSLDFAWRECVFEIETAADGSMVLTHVGPTSAQSAVTWNHSAQRRGVHQVSAELVEAEFAEGVARDVVKEAPAGLLPPGASRWVVVLWTDVDPDEEVRVFGHGRVTLDAEGDRGGGYRAAPMQLRVEATAETRAAAEPAAAAERALKLLQLQYRGGMGLLAFGLAWAVGFFL